MVGSGVTVVKRVAVGYGEGVDVPAGFAENDNEEQEASSSDRQISPAMLRLTIVQRSAINRGIQILPATANRRMGNPGFRNKHKRVRNP